MNKNTIEVNEACRALAQMYGKQVPTMKASGCTLCGSLSLKQVVAYLQDGGDARWLEPMVDTWVYSLLLNDGRRFNLRHLYDEPLTDSEREEGMGVIEDHAGNLQLFIRELNKYGE